MSAGELLPRREQQALGGERVDPVGHDRRVAPADRPEQVSVGHQAQALVPGVVRRAEVGVDFVPVGQLGRRRLADQAPHQVRAASAELVEPGGQQDVLPPGDAVGHGTGKEPACARRQSVAARHGQHVGRGPLKQRHVRGVGGDRRHQGHRGGTTADHHHPLVGEVEVVRPVLRVHDPALVVVDSGELRGVALVVVVVAAARPEHVTGEGHLVAVVLGGDRPAPVGRRPVRPSYGVAVADALVDAVLRCGLADVAEDRRAVGQRLVALPGTEPVAQRVHVGVRAHARVAEEIPGAATGLARLEDRVAATRDVGGEVAGRADPGEPCPHDQDVDVVRGLRHAVSLGSARPDLVRAK